MTLASRLGVASWNQFDQIPFLLGELANEGVHVHETSPARTSGPDHFRAWTCRLRQHRAGRRKGC